MAKHVDTASTSISTVMTPNPTCVAMTDLAMDAMSTMVENHFRRLPVVDEAPEQMWAFLISPNVSMTPSPNWKSLKLLKAALR